MKLGLITAAFMLGCALGACTKSQQQEALDAASAAAKVGACAILKIRQDLAKGMSQMDSELDAASVCTPNPLLTMSLTYPPDAGP